MKYQSLATFLKQKRIEAGLTQAHVAAHLGFSTPQFVSNWERAVAAPSASVLIKLSDLYNVDVQEIYSVVLAFMIEDVKEKTRIKFFGKNIKRKQK